MHPVEPTPPNRRRFLGAALLATLSLPGLTTGCASRPEVRTDRDPGVDLSHYKTYTLHQLPLSLVPGSGSAPRLGEPVGASYTTLQQARLEQATRAQLEKRGLTQTALDPDLRVHLALKVTREKELHGVPGARFGGGTRGFGAWGGGTIGTVEVRQGTLVIDLVDARRNALVWRGVAEGAIDDSAAENPGGAIDRTVAEVFAHFKR